MNGSAILMMTLTFIAVTFVAGYFFLKVLRTSRKSEPEVSD